MSRVSLRSLFTYLDLGLRNDDGLLEGGVGILVLDEGGVGILVEH